MDGIARCAHSSYDYHYYLTVFSHSLASVTQHPGEHAVVRSGALAHDLAACIGLLLVDATSLSTTWKPPPYRRQNRSPYCLPPSVPKLQRHEGRPGCSRLVIAELKSCMNFRPAETHRRKLVDAGVRTCAPPDLRTLQRALAMGKQLAAMRTSIRLSMLSREIVRQPCQPTSVVALPHRGHAISPASRL